MRRWLLARVLLALACALVACGRVGPPVRPRPQREATPAVQPAAAPAAVEQDEQSEEEEKP